MNKFILTVAVLAVCTTSLLAQSFGASSVLLRNPGSANSVTLQAPAVLSGNHIFTFPNASGTLLTSTALPGFTWSLGGNSLIGTGLPSNILGTSSAHDVVLVAGGVAAVNTRLTLLNASNAVQTGAGTELRLLNPLGTNHSSFKAGTQIANIEYILPTSGPTVANQVLRATNTGNPVVLEWATVSGGGSGTLLKIQGSDQTTASGTLHTSTGLQYVLATGTTYSVTGTIRVSTVNASNDPTIRFTSPGVGSTINLTFNNGGTTFNVTAFDADYTLNNTTTGMEDWSVSGSISTSVLVAASGLQFQRTSPSNMTLGAGSNLLFVP